jgi:hypothetical protein
MTIFYGAVLFIGFVMLVVWLVLTAVAAGVDGWDDSDPERRFGTRGRSVVAGTFGFGMAGISMLYTQMPDALSLVAAVAGAAGLIVVSRWLGPVEPS